MNIYHTILHIMSYHIYNHEKLKRFNLASLTNVIYSNFIELSNYPTLKHTKNDIYNLLKSENVLICLYITNKKIGGYMVGEFMKLNDGRHVFYVSYIYTGIQFRKHGVGSKMMKIVDGLVQQYGLDGIMLTCDSNDQSVYDFYLKKGFMPDMILRNYGQHEVMYK